MKKKLLVMGILLVFILSAASLAYAFPGYGLGKGQAFKDLNLTDEQIKKITDIRTQYFDKMLTLRNDLAKLNFELRNLYLQNNPDQKLIDDKISKIKELKDKMLSLKQEEFEKIKGVLTAEQLSKLQNQQGLPGGIRGKAGRGFGVKGFGRGFCPLY